MNSQLLNFCSTFKVIQIPRVCEARVVRPGWLGQGGEARVVRPGWCGQGGAARVVRPGWGGQGGVVSLGTCDPVRLPNATLNKLRYARAMSQNHRPPPRVKTYSTSRFLINFPEPRISATRDTMGS